MCRTENSGCRVTDGRLDRAELHFAVVETRPYEDLIENMEASFIETTYQIWQRWNKHGLATEQI